MLTGPDGRHSLSPAYDIVSSAVYKEYSSALALPLSAEDILLSAAGWARFAAACRIPPTVAAGILRRPAGQLAAAIELVEHSRLPTGALRGDYRQCVTARAEALEGWGRALPGCIAGRRPAARGPTRSDRDDSRRRWRFSTTDHPGRRSRRSSPRSLKPLPTTPPAAQAFGVVDRNACSPHASPYRPIVRGHQVDAHHAQPPPRRVLMKSRSGPVRPAVGAEAARPNPKGAGKGTSHHMLTRTTTNAVALRASSMRRMRRRAVCGKPLSTAPPTVGTSFLVIDEIGGVAHCEICGYTRRLG